MPIFSFRCETEQCSQYNQEVELLVNASELNHPVLCDNCLNQLTKLVSAPYGRVVRGASNHINIDKRRNKT